MYSISKISEEVNGLPDQEPADATGLLALEPDAKTESTGAAKAVSSFSQKLREAEEKRGGRRRKGSERLRLPERKSLACQELSEESCNSSLASSSEFDHSSFYSPPKRAKKSAKKFNGYIQQYFRVSGAQYEFIQRVTEGLDKETRHLFCHALSSGLLQCSERDEATGEVWVPVGSELIKAEIRGASWKKLKDRGLCKVKGYDRAAGRSREFCPAPAIIEEFLDVNDGLSLEQFLSLSYVNLFTGEPMRPVEGSSWDKNRNPVGSKECRRMLEMYRKNGTRIDLREIDEHVKRSKLAMKAAKQALDEAENADGADLAAGT